jgi:hypothetical protein
MYLFATAIVQHICEGGGLMSYMAMYMDTIPKLLNHLLFGLGICNIFLFFAAMSGDYATNRISIHAFFISVLLCSQTACVWRILNHGRNGEDGVSAIDHFRVFTPSEFLVGVALGITIGGAILSFVLSRFFGQLSTQCDREQIWISRQTNTTLANNIILNSILRECIKYRGSILAVWFWSGMVFWFNLGAAILIAMGRNELTDFRGQYETIDPDGGNSGGVGGPQIFPRYQTDASSSNSFAGNYPSVPEVRPGVAAPRSNSWDASTATDPLSSHQHSKPSS